MDEKIWQEFYCGECQGYFRVKLNIALNHEVEMVCPKCKHKHRRCIKDGVIYEGGRYATSCKEEICPPLSAYSKEPLTRKMEKTKYARDGVVIDKEDDLSKRHPSTDSMLRERWFELYGGK